MKIVVDSRLELFCATPSVSIWQELISSAPMYYHLFMGGRSR